MSGCGPLECRARNGYHGMDWGVYVHVLCVCMRVGWGGGRCNYLGSSWKDRWLQLQSHSAPTPSSRCRGTLKTAPLTPSSLTSTPSRLPSSPSAGAQGLACTLSPSQGLSLSPCHRGQAEAQQGSAGAGSPPQAVCCHPLPPTPNHCAILPGARAEWVSCPHFQMKKSRLRDKIRAWTRGGLETLGSVLRHQAHWPRLAAQSSERSGRALSLGSLLPPPQHEASTSERSAVVPAPDCPLHTHPPRPSSFCSGFVY